MSTLPATAPTMPVPAALDPLADLRQRLAQAPPARVVGQVTKAIGPAIEATGLLARVGEVCELSVGQAAPLLAEVMGFNQGTALLAPMGAIDGLTVRASVLPTGHAAQFPVGPGLLGRVLDPLGVPIDGGGPLTACVRVEVQAPPPPALSRQRIAQPLPTGVRALDTLLTLGEGQRIGVFAPPGAGKSTLLGMLARHCEADVVVVALVGERGREVAEFLEVGIGARRERCVMVVATSDRPAAERLRCAQAATRVAEHFRDEGQRVLLLVDSLTRLARAQREIGLACGEPPTRRSYPPSVFTMLPRLLERAGPGQRGTITAVYTVLTEGDADNDPVAEEVRSILDGHVVLSRDLAGAGHYPAIDVLGSISRVMPRVVDETHRRAAGRVRALMARYKEVELLLQIGEYRPGADPEADAAVRHKSQIDALLRQDETDAIAWPQALAALQSLASY
ncbi:FliI/YscN family ATPase [Ideonella sp.]|uniref:FliI/YscN family ATPase n=1 Tax=Ideonella sp. TaxID=1929293 RepID=UPI0035B1C23E